MDQKLKEKLEDLFTKISFTITEQGFSVPLFIMHLSDGEMMPVMMSGHSEISIEEYASAAMLGASEMNAMALIFICEQYVVSKRKDDVEMQCLLNGTIKPSDHPDREECLTMIYMDKKGKCISLIGKIEKDIRGTKYINETHWTQGSVTNIIQPWG